MREKSLSLSGRPRDPSQCPTRSDGSLPRVTVSMHSWIIKFGATGSEAGGVAVGRPASSSGALLLVAMGDQSRLLSYLTRRTGLLKTGGTVTEAMFSGRAEPSRQTTHARLSRYCSWLARAWPRWAGQRCDHCGVAGENLDEHMTQGAAASRHWADAREEPQVALSFLSGQTIVSRGRA